jgi:uncharacterized protein (TIGR01777 family)
MKYQRNKLIIAGGTGFLGHVLLQRMAPLFDEVVVLCRKPFESYKNIRCVQWDGKQPGSWVDEIDGANVLINLTGKSVNCRYTAENKKQILESRLASTLALGAAVIMASHPPKLWINSSSATIYRHAEDRPQDEYSGETGDDFSMNVCRQWEETFFDIPTPTTRKVAIRTALVLGQQGGVYPVFRKLANMGLAGKQGSGRQMTSWIHELDFVSALRFIIDSPEIDGVINLAAPHPVSNEEFIKTMRHSLGHSCGLPQTKWMLEIGAWILGTETELVTKSRWVVPTRLLSCGFDFKYPFVQQAFNALKHKTDDHAHSQSSLENTVQLA